MSGSGEGCAGREECHRLGGVRQDAKRRIVRIKINEDKLRTFAALCRAHLSMEAAAQETQRAGAHQCPGFDRYFQLERHYTRGLEIMQMRVALSLSVMLAMPCTSIREGQPPRMKSLIVPL